MITLDLWKLFHAAYRAEFKEFIRSDDLEKSLCMHIKLHILIVSRYSELVFILLLFQASQSQNGSRKQDS